MLDRQFAKSKPVDEHFFHRQTLVFSIGISIRTPEVTEGHQKVKQTSRKRHAFADHFGIADIDEFDQYGPPAERMKTKSKLKTVTADTKIDHLRNEMDLEVKRFLKIAKLQDQIDEDTASLKTKALQGDKVQPGYRLCKKWRAQIIDPRTVGGRKKQLIVALARGFGVDWWRICTGQTTPDKLGLVMAD